MAVAIEFKNVSKKFNKAGYYAIVGIRAGNLTKNIKVTRFPAHS